MKMIVLLDDTGHVKVASIGGVVEGGVEVDVLEGFDMEQQNDWRLVDGALVHDPLPIPSPTPTPEEVNAANIAYLAMMTGVSL